jgi:hypothetical protein
MLHGRKCRRRRVIAYSTPIALIDYAGATHDFDDPGKKRQSVPGNATARGRAAAGGGDFCEVAGTFFVMAGLVPAIHVLLALMPRSRGCPGQAQA